MNDYLFELLLNERSVHKQEELHDFCNDMQPDAPKWAFIDKNERQNSIVAAKLRMGREANNLTEEIFQRALDKVSDFIYAMKDSFSEEEETIDYETIIEESVVVKFKSHPRMRLNIYYDEESVGDENPEESYLLYEKQGRMTLVNNTIRNNVDLIKSLLKL